MKKQSSRQGRRRSDNEMVGIHKRSAAKRPSGFVYWYEAMIKGERLRVNLKTDIPAEALRLKWEHRTAFLREQKTRKKGTLSSLIAPYLKYKLSIGKHTQSSSDNAAGYLVRFVAKIGDGKPNKVTRQAAEDWFSQRRREVAESTAGGELSYIKAYFAWLHSNRYIVENPFKDLSVPKICKKGKVIYCSRSERDRIFTQASMFDEQNATKKATSNGHFGKFQITTQEMLFVLFCAFHVGMRKREIIECRRDWVNLEKGFMQIKGTSTFAPKDKEARKVPLSPAFMDYLRRAGGFSQTANQQEEAPYILKPNRKQKKSRYRYDPRKPFERLVSAAGVPWMTLHGARHTFATLLLDQGASISNVAMWLGDDEQVARSHYIHHLSENEHHRHLFG